MSNNSKKHDYKIAEELLVKLIIDGGYCPGDKLPSRTKLSKQLDIGLISIQLAVKSLEKEGILSNIRGSGCYIRKIPVVGGENRDLAKGPSLFFDEIYSGFPVQSGRTVIRFALSDGELEYYGEHWKRIFLEFQKRNSGIEIETVAVAGIDDLKSKMLSGEVDIFQVPLEFLPFFVNSGYIFRPEQAGELALDPNVFFERFHDSSLCNGIAWGIPLATNTTCLFYQDSCRNFIDSIFPVKGFWDFLEKLQKSDLKKQGRTEAFIANDYLLSGFLANCPGNLTKNDFDSGAVYDSPGFIDFVRKFHEYYMNRKIFHPEINEGKENVISNFIEGRSMMAFGNISWISRFHKRSFYSWGIANEPVEKGGHSRLNGMLNSISAATYHPSECLDILNFLADFETQKSFALKGRPVARKDACQHLKVQNLDERSKENLLKSFETGKVDAKKTFNENDFAATVIAPEMARWHSGAYSADEFCKVVQRKKVFFYEAIKFRMNHSGDFREKIGVDEYCAAK